MKLTNLFTAFILTIPISTVLAAQQDTISLSRQIPDAVETTTPSNTKRLNFYIVSKRKKGKLDLATRYNVLRSKLKNLFRKKDFNAIVARDAEKMSAKVLCKLKKYNAQIGTIWFDSHGMYKKGISLFFIGHDEYNYKTAKDSLAIIPLKKLAAFSDHQTKVVIGSCYGGATYYRSSINYKDTTRMNGDSLMIALGNIFSQSKIYGCESWVMSKPGLFRESSAVAGFPGRNLFHDICYCPVWKNLGKWNEYNAATNNFTSVNTVTLDKYGNLKVRIWGYTGHRDLNKDLKKNLAKLEPGLYK